MPIASTRSSISLMGSFPVQSRSLGLYGNGGFNVPFPAFLPEYTYQVLRNRAFSRSSNRSCNAAVDYPSISGFGVV